MINFHYLCSAATCHYSSVTGEVVTGDTSKGPFTPIVIVSTALTLAVLVSLKTMEQPHSGDCIVFNERDIASITTALMLTLSVNEPLWPLHRSFSGHSSEWIVSDQDHCHAL